MCVCIYICISYPPSDRSTPSINAMGVLPFFWGFNLSHIGGKLKWNASYSFSIISLFWIPCSHGTLSFWDLFNFCFFFSSFRKRMLQQLGMIKFLIWKCIFNRLRVNFLYVYVNVLLYVCIYVFTYVFMYVICGGGIESY